MAQILANGLIQFSDGQILYSDTPVDGQRFMELQELLPKINPVIGRSAMVGFPFVSGGGGGGGGGGTPGARGVDGAPGATGPQGVTGPSGGPQGATGVQGIQGQTGPGGGSQGATGIQGVTGIAGVNGATGIQGATGPGSSVRNDATGTTTATPTPLFTDSSTKFVMGIGTVKNTGANGMTVQETVTDAFGTTTSITTNVPAGNTYMLDPQTNIGTGLPPYVSYGVSVFDQVPGNHTTFVVHFGAFIAT